MDWRTSGWITGVLKRRRRFLVNEGEHHEVR
jgi:hypothetical protein